MKHPVLELEGLRYSATPGETVLDAALRAGVEIPFSCRGGVCRRCLLRCVSGHIPTAGCKTLPGELVKKGYLLACQCHPEGDMQLQRPDPTDLKTPCVFHGLERSGDYLLLRFETVRELPCHPGQVLLLEDADALRLEIEITSATPEAFQVEALLRMPPAAPLPDWLQNDEFGHEFDVSGPLSPPLSSNSETSPAAADPALWNELGNGSVVRQILESFYSAVYQDSQLSTFFDGVTIDRAIDKQYSFLQQLMSGNKVYFGDRPRNAHHWMVITPALFEHRQQLMRDSLEMAGLSAGQIARWTRLEQHYRTDIVKTEPWPRLVGDTELPLEGFADEVLSEATLCDYCGAVIESGVRVRYHLRMGKVSCPSCSATVMDTTT